MESKGCGCSGLDRLAPQLSKGPEPHLGWGWGLGKKAQPAPGDMRRSFHMAFSPAGKSVSGE